MDLEEDTGRIIWQSTKMRKSKQYSRIQLRIQIDQRFSVGACGEEDSWKGDLWLGQSFSTVAGMGVKFSNVW